MPSKQEKGQMISLVLMEEDKDHLVVLLKTKESWKENTYESIGKIKLERKKK